MNKTRFFNAAKTDKDLTLSIYDAIGQGFFGDGITASMVQDALNQDEDYDTITLRINSAGGDAFEGVAICNLLKSSGKPVNVIVDGLAASAASIVAMAGSTVTMNKGAMMMIHPAQGMAMGDAATVREFADTLDKVTESIADIYTARTGLAKDKVLKMMNDETWLNDDEAIENKFADKKGSAERVSNSFDLSRFKNAPAELKNQVKTKEVDGEHLTAGDFVYVGNPDDTSTWSLPWHFSTDEKTKSHLRDALARFDQDEVIPASHRDEAYAKLLRLCKEHGIEVSRRGNPKNESDYKVDLRLKHIAIERRK